MMRIVIDARAIRTTGSQVLPRGGIGRYVFHLVRNLVRDHPEIDLLLLVPRRNRRPVVDPGGPGRVRELPCAWESNSWRSFLRLGDQLQRAGAELFHGTSGTLPLFVPCRSVVTVHDTLWFAHPHLCSPSFVDRWTLGPLYRTAARHALTAATTLLAPSRATVEEIDTHLPGLGQRIRVVPNGVDPFFRALDPQEAQRELAGIVPPESPFVTMLGTCSPNKNHLRAVRGFFRAFSRRPEVKLVLARRSLRFDPRMIWATLGLRARRRLITLPWVSDRRLRALYSRARLFLFPSLMEGFGIPPLEAMACGTPVITSNVSAMPEVCGDAALQVAPRSVEAIAAALRRLDEDATLRETLIARGLARARQFSWATCAAQTFAHYRDTLAA